MDEALFIIAGWLLFAGLVAALAVAWNRSGAKWLLTSLLLSPLIGFTALVVSGKRAEDAPPEHIASGGGVLMWALLILIGLVVLFGAYVAFIR